MARKNAATRKDLQGSFDVGAGNPKFEAKPDLDSSRLSENVNSGYPFTRKTGRGPAARKNAAKRMPRK
jgi:hypothetical protein